MGRRRRLAAVLVAVSLAGFLIGGGARMSLALFRDSESTDATFTTAACLVDAVAPGVDATVGSKTALYLPGYIRQGSPYYVYANVTDAGGGCSPSGVATVRANLTSITTGQTSAALASGSFSVGGVAYGYRTASLTANATLAPGAHTYSITSTDGLANAQTETGYSVIVDNARPAGADIQTTNGGLIVGKAEAGDSVTYTFSEPIDPQTVLAGWTGAPTNVVARIAQKAGGDRLTIRNAANSAQLPLGAANLMGLAYVGATRDFGATGTPSTMVQAGNTITITFGTASGATGTEVVTGVVSWAPTTTLTDRAGNACQTTTVLETGAATVEF